MEKHQPCGHLNRESIVLYNRQTKKGTAIVSRTFLLSKKSPESFYFRGICLYKNYFLIESSL